MSKHIEFPGHSHRLGITLVGVMEMFPDDEVAEAWFADRKWGGRPCCPVCGSVKVRRAEHRSMPYRCGETGCYKRFSVRYGTLMEGSKVGYRVWAIAMYLMTTNLKGVSSMKLHRDLGVTQKTAWFLAHRIREAWATEDPLFSGPVEADETYIGGLEKNKHQNKRMKAAGGPAGKAIVAGVKERSTGKVVARVVTDTSAATLTGLVADHTEPGATVYTDEAYGYKPLTAMGYDHHSVKHSMKQWVVNMAHTNGVESFWSMLKRGYYGTYHQMSKQHLHRYVTEFSGRANHRPMHTYNQLEALARNMVGKRLRYIDLINHGPHPQH